MSPAAKIMPFRIAAAAKKSETVISSIFACAAIMFRIPLLVARKHSDRPLFFTLTQYSNPKKANTANAYMENASVSFSKSI